MLSVVYIVVVFVCISVYSCSLCVLLYIVYILVYLWCFVHFLCV